MIQILGSEKAIYSRHEKQAKGKATRYLWSSQGPDYFGPEGFMIM